MTDRHEESEFDLRARAELAMAYEADQPPESLFRKASLLGGRGVRVAAAVLVVLGAALTGVLEVRPPQLVRGAIDHEYYERTLRGSFMQEEALLQHLGLGQRKTVPGFPQLMRPCDIDGRLVYHLTTFFEKGGMVTVFAYDSPIELKERSGWWDNVYWEVVRTREGKPLILIAQKKSALAVARASFAGPPA